MSTPQCSIAQVSGRHDQYVGFVIFMGLVLVTHVH